ncbi:hypothetical protein C2G38_2255328 [Gigaspora rosea]|uniref:Helicase superfamily 3 single-stranded DNA/RNA virus domain-containing protein n=1 Tax=Gigaspora rosea TaxID=44941 RepID=A0A397U1H0_9GLOM|nr:hypothetical protein C2G38_2255328 [Gigaspora rosea]
MKIDLQSASFYISNRSKYCRESCPFSLLKFQFKLNRKSEEPSKYHTQAYVKVRKEKQQIALGSYNSKTKKGSGIKEIFQANPHIEHANGTEEQCLDYCGKDFDRCKNPLLNPNSKKGEKCKCDFFDLTKRYKFCNENCERLFARISEDPNIAGPFVFIYDESKFKNQKEDNDNDDDAYLEAVSDILNGKDVNETIVKFAPKCKKWAYTPQGLREIAEAMKSKTLNLLYNMKRYWKPIIIYIYGNPGTGKSEICKDLFPGIYEKADNEWLTDRNHCEMNVKYGKTYIVAMYICITSNGPIENLYTRLRKNNSSINIDAFIRRVKFIIKYEGESIDENGKGDIIRIFEKGNKKEFNEKIFDIEFNKGTTLEEVDKVTINLGIEENIDNKTDRVVTNISKSDPGERILVSSSEKRKKNQTYQDPQEESSKTEKSCLQLEIQQNYQKSLKTKENIVENNDDDFDMCEDIELDISEETTYKEFNRKNKNNSLYLGFKILKSKIEKKTKTAKTRCLNCRNQEIKCEPSIENLTEQDCIKIKPSCYKEEIKNLNKLLNETKLKSLELEKQILTLKRNHQLFKKNIENLNTILNFQ